jgi:hypothetical protein
MSSSGMLRHVALVRADVSEELSASFIRVTKIGELGTTQAETSNRRCNQQLTDAEKKYKVTASVVPSSPILVVLHRRHITSPLQSPAS